MARQAVEGMRDEGLIENLQAEKPLQRRLLHLAHVGETHVVVDERQYLLRLVIGKSQTLTDLLGYANSRFHVPVKTYAVRCHAKSGRLPNIVEQSTPGESRWDTSGKPVEQHQRVHPDITLGMVLRR